MPSEKFLQQVADYYIDNNIDLAKTTMVFPNRRSALFMRMYLRQRMHNTSFMPRLISITYFTQQLCEATLADNTELIFILYKVYCNVLRRHNKESQIPDFDGFYFWGSVLLNDFNDIDAYLVDVDQIFKNIKNEKEISSNFLTPEQIEVAELLWGKDAITFDPVNFWRHLPSDPSKAPASQHFLSLWEIMGEVYSDFIKALDSRRTPLAYSGLQSRRACQKIKMMSIEDFYGRQYAFIGFNVLSTSRIQIFNRLKDLKIARFFWDVSSPLLSNDSLAKNRAAEFIMNLSHMFPMPDDFELQPITHIPQIEVISVPSNIGQVKAMSQVLNEWGEQWKKESPDNMVAQDKLLDTAVILADESLLMPVLYSIPPSINTINVTMGLSYSTTPFAALMSSIISMHLRSYISRGVYHYFYQDVKDVLSHPHISLIAPDEALQIIKKISEQHIYNVGAQWLCDNYPSLAFLFTPITDQKNIYDVKQYITTLIISLSRLLKSKLVGGDTTDYYEIRILEGYQKAIDHLCELIEKYSIEMHERIFLQMIERTLASSVMNFAGEPLKGLQIMSVMDTRSLDFDNIIMISVNERMFPKRNYNPSLIPANLRATYLMPTQEHEEASYAYQFYRLISHSKRVKLIYDSRIGGLSSGEISRYVAQLLHLHKDYGIKVSNIEFTPESTDPKPVVIKKTPEVIEELRQFRPGGRRKLSASAIKTYISCPLKFYLQYVKGLRVNDDVMEYIDAASLGTVMHAVAQDLYMPYKDKRVNEETIKKMMSDNIEQRALMSLNEKYYRNRYDGRLEDIPGEGHIIAKIIATYLKKMLKCEAQFDPFVFVGAEVGEHQKVEWEINDKYAINFTMSIDRIDCIKPSDDPSQRVLRFIDYKTGSDMLSATNINQLFTDSKYGAILQLLVYCHAYAKVYGFNGKIKPVIYKFQTMNTEGIPDIKLSKTVLSDYRLASEDGFDFYPRFEQLIDMIFEEEGRYDFSQTPDEKHCAYCPFATMCNRFVDPPGKF